MWSDVELQIYGVCLWDQTARGVDMVLGTTTLPGTASVWTFVGVSLLQKERGVCVYVCILTGDFDRSLYHGWVSTRTFYA